jgi:hypothetical protein
MRDYAPAIALLLMFLTMAVLRGLYRLGEWVQRRRLARLLEKECWQ